MISAVIVRPSIEGSLLLIVFLTSLYGVSMKPCSFVREKVASEPSNPMLGPSGVSINFLIIWIKSSLSKVLISVLSLPSILFNLYLPTAPRSYLLSLKNVVSISSAALDSLGGSPGLIRL